VVGSGHPAASGRLAIRRGRALKEVDVTAAKKAARSAPTKPAVRRAPPKKPTRPAKKAASTGPKAATKRATPAKKSAAPKKVPKVTKASPAAKRAVAKKAPAVKKAAPVRKAAPAKKAAPPKPVASAKPAAKAPPKRPTVGPYAKEEKFLEEQRSLLLDERSVYEGQATDLRAEADSLALEREPGDVQFDEESGEGGTVTVDRERNLALSAQASAAVEEIDDALRKIERKTYGACERCHQAIPKARLRALPFARLCVACKSGGLSRR
jgi:DnaK suppressor protein